MNSGQMMLEIAVWSVLWIGFIMVSVRVFPFTIEHDYPLEARKVAQLPTLTEKYRIKGILFGLFGIVVLFGMLIIIALFHFDKQNSSFWSIFQYVWIICMAWNLIDLIIVDWLLICLISCRFLVLPGTEQCKGNKNYLFHFIGFLKGCVAMTVVALLVSTISYGIIQLR